MTNSEINIALAKWHMEHGDDVCGDIHGAQPYTVSLDTMRTIEDFMTTAEATEFSRIIWSEHFYGRPDEDDGTLVGLFASAETRARAAVKVWGLETKNEAGMPSYCDPDHIDALTAELKAANETIATMRPILVKAAHIERPKFTEEQIQNAREILAALDGEGGVN